MYTIHGSRAPQCDTFVLIGTQINFIFWLVGVFEHFLDLSIFCFCSQFGHKHYRPTYTSVKEKTSKKICFLDKFWVAETEN